MATACGGSLTEPPVIEPLPVYGIIVGIGAPSLTLVFPGMTVNMFAQANDSLHHVLPVASFTWSTSDATIATVDTGGHVMAKRTGLVNIAAAAGGRTGGYTMHVVNPTDNYAIDPDTSLMLPGQRRSLMFVDGLINNSASKVVTGAWSSSNSAVVRVDSNGVLTAVAPGRASITLPYVAGIPFTLAADVSVSSVPLPLRFDEVVKGGGFTCGRTASDTYCWGIRKLLGTTATADRCSFIQDFISSHPSYTVRSVTDCAMEPVRVEAPATFIHISATNETACGLVADGRAYCWGNASFLTGGTANSQTPVLASATLRFGSFDYPCGVTLSAEAWCWGNGSLRGTRDSLPTPSRVDGGAIWRTVTGGNSIDHRCGVTVMQTTLCWGANGMGQLGTGDTLASMVPRPVQGIPLLASVRTDWRNSCGLATTGELWCWGEGRTTPFSPNPALRFASLTDLGHCATTTADGQIYCGSGGASFVVLPVTMGFRSVAKTGSVTCGIGLDGISYCWVGGPLELNADLGVGDLKFRPAPTPVVGQ